MLENIIASLVTGLLALLGVILTNSASNKRITNKLETNQEVTNTKIEHLTEEVRQHNNFAVRIPSIETRLSAVERTVDKMEDKINGAVHSRTSQGN